MVGWRPPTASPVSPWVEDLGSLCWHPPVHQGFQSHPLYKGVEQARSCGAQVHQQYLRSSLPSNPESGRIADMSMRSTFNCASVSAYFAGAAQVVLMQAEWVQKLHERSQHAPVHCFH